MIRAAALTGALLLMTIPGGVSVAQTADDPVIAIVNGDEVRNSDMNLFYGSLPEQYRNVPMVSLYDQLIEGLIERKLLAQAARDAGMMDDPQVKQRLAYVADDVLQQTYLDQLLATEVTDERMRAVYAETTASQSGADEVSARHILLEDEAAAKAVIEELNGGADFAALAKERSTGPSGPGGGDLGFFTKDQMVTPFAEAAFALKIGDYTAEPVQTQFGWHVIKVEDRRTSAPPSFEESQAELGRQMAQEFVLGLMTKLRDDAEITRFDPEGNEVAKPAE